MHTVEIGLQRQFYDGFENTGETEEICLSIFANNADFANGLSGIIEDVFSGSLSAQLIPMDTNTATSKFTRLYFAIMILYLPSVNADFSGEVLNLIVTPDALTPCVRISIFDDIILDDNETFRISLTSSNPGVILQPSASSAEVTILDDDIGASKNLDIFHA